MRQITDLPGIRVGHATDREGRTGCTVILCDGGAVAGADIRGSAPGTVEIEVLKPVRLVPKIDGLFFTGGSALGLPAVKGVQDYLQEQGVGYDTGFRKIPIVPGAVIYDIGPDEEDAIPSAETAYQAAHSATDEPMDEGAVGAGTGATLGNMFGHSATRRGGVATAADETPDGIRVGVLVVANAFGGVYDPEHGRWLVGHENYDRSLLYQNPEQLWSTNTTLVAVGTDAALSKEQCIKVAEMSQDGIARVIRPSHTMFDGDLSVVLSLGSQEGEVNGIGDLAAELTSRAILRSVELSNG